MKMIEFSSVPKQFPEAAIHETVLYSDVPYELHGHNFYELFIVEQGKLRHILNTKPIDMVRGEFYLIYSEDIHQLEKISEEPASLVNISFTERLFHELMAEACLDEKIPSMIRHGQLSSPELIAAEQILALLTRVELSPIENLNQRMALLKNLIETILLSRQLMATPPASSIPEWLYQTVDSLQDQRVLQEGIQGMVKTCGFSQEHLTRQIRKYYNKTPSQIVNQYRINYAQKLLSTTKLSILDISMQVGYESVSYFNRMFAKQLGMSPSVYRRSLQNFI